MRGDGAFGCCHSHKSNEDGINRESGIGVPGDDDAHCRLKFFIAGGDSGFAVGGVEVLPGYGGIHGVHVGVLFDGFLKKVQDGGGDGRMETEHDVS